MAPYEAFDDDVEVHGRTIIAVADDALARFSDAYRETAFDALADNGIDDPSADEWYPQQAWLNTFETIAAELEPHILDRLGEQIPDVAEWPSGDNPGEDGGELQDHTEISVWIDEGIFTGNGELEELPVIGDDTVAEGTLAEVADQDPEATGDGEYRIRVDGTDCFSPGDEVYVAFEWRIPETVGNIIQSDSATFQVAFDPRPCTEG
ncbi:hypothetical protein [Haloplanus salinus]|uniref:hypothetical protein n=1 Tax=Haloplanus salinus TaxID=1126245 RepID=UPI0015F00C2A|nr:hypothetical protein [Haloplanus salinus]